MNLLKRLSVGLAAACLIVQAAAAPTAVVPVGRAVGIELETEGVLVTGFSSEFHDHICGEIRVGDRITTVNGAEIHSVCQLRQALETSPSPLILGIVRGECAGEFVVEPTQQTTKLGLQVRDGLRGIGTITYYDPETGYYGALGHGITQDGALLPVRNGQLVEASITGLRKGKAGSPGELHGSQSGTEKIGTVVCNCSSGIFGKLTAAPLAEDTKLYPIASQSEITEGQAVILANVEGELVCAYDVQIVRIDAAAEDGKSLLLRVTDQALLEKTGGIVQGMSGSPILQNGKLVGAVTHVLVNEPTYGYGILAEQMLKSAENAGF